MDQQDFLPMNMHRDFESLDGAPTGAITWTLKGGRVLGLAPFLVMGILNVTPDSFSDGGLHCDPDQATSHAGRLFSEGAAIVDVGGESTRPFSDLVPEDEEIRRVLPVIKAVTSCRPEAVVSVDTYKAGVADRALRAGALIVNDVSAFVFEPGLLDVLVQHKPGYVLMHSQGRPKTMQVEPRYDDILAEISEFFEERMAALVRAGLPEDRIVLDPGIGFGKTVDHNLAILRGLESFTALGRPLLMGLSKKSFLGTILGAGPGKPGGAGEPSGPDKLGPATQVATALAFLRGAIIHRVHHVAETVQALTLARALR